MQSFLVKTLVLALVAAIHAAAPQVEQRIVGGSLTTINSYPYLASLLYASDLVNYRQRCAGFILNTRTICTVASCVVSPPNHWRTRVGSSYANIGGVVHDTHSILIHPWFRSFEWDVALMKTVTTIVYTNAVQPAAIAGANYNLGDNQVVWTAGWGADSFSGVYSEQLREVQMWTINQKTCRRRYDQLLPFSELDFTNMVCAGRMDIGNVGPCSGDNGVPLLHGQNKVAVGIFTWQQGCGQPRYPSIMTRMANVSEWIASNA